MPIYYKKSDGTIVEFSGSGINNAGEIITDFTLTGEGTVEQPLKVVKLPGSITISNQRWDGSTDLVINQTIDGGTPDSTFD